MKIKLLIFIAILLVPIGVSLAQTADDYTAP
jgi:hypothetical protein